MTQPEMKNSNEIEIFESTRQEEPSLDQQNNNNQKLNFSLVQDDTGESKNNIFV